MKDEGSRESEVAAGKEDQSVTVTCSMSGAVMIEWQNATTKLQHATCDMLQPERL
jgi:hypothetical protein